MEYTTTSCPDSSSFPTYNASFFRRPSFQNIALEFFCDCGELEKNEMNTKHKRNGKFNSYSPRDASNSPVQERLHQLDQPDSCHLREVQMILERMSSATNWKYTAGNDVQEESAQFENSNRRKNSFSTRWRSCFASEEEDGVEKEQSLKREWMLANKPDLLTMERRKEDGGLAVQRSQSLRYYGQRKASMVGGAGKMDEEQIGRTCNEDNSNGDQDGYNWWNQNNRPMDPNSMHIRSRSISTPKRRDRRSQSMRVPNCTRTQIFPDQPLQHFQAYRGHNGSAEQVEYERMRTFSIDPNKPRIINRGDSFRRRFSTGEVLQTRHYNDTSEEAAQGSGLLYSSHIQPYLNNLEISGQGQIASSDSEPALDDASEEPQPRKYEIIVVGIDGVGKTSLINQFMTSEYRNPFLQADAEAVSPENTVTVQLNGDESQLAFVEVDSHQNEDWLSMTAHGYLIVYSIDDALSFRNAKKLIRDLRRGTETDDRPVILVANKIDLERKRQVTADDGRSVARDFDCKFVEITVGLGHHVDELLVGILTQIKLREEQVLSTEEDDQFGTPLDNTHRDSIADRLPPQIYDRRDSSLLSGRILNGHPFPSQHIRRPSTKCKKRGSQCKVNEDTRSVSPRTSCTNLTAVGQRFVQKMFGRKRSSKSLEDLLSLP